MALLAFAAASVLVPACRGKEAAADGAPTPSVPGPDAAAAAAADPQKLAGRWLRADSNYTIEVARVGPDGSVEATYSNPQPIHVSRAAWRTEGGRLALFVELTDRGYPGNNYALLYDPGSDSLSGEYRHLGLNETYEVAFSRVAAPTP
jgi:hypothetical protein